MKTVLHIFLGIILGLLLGGVLWLAASPPQGESVQLVPAPTIEPIRIHVAGAVVRPGVYELPRGARIQDAVEAAGGFVAEADKHTLNLAVHLEDGERLNVPYLAGYETAEGEGFVIVSEGTPNPIFDDLVNINTATKAELMKLPGIGDAYAQRIIDYRNEHGDFARIEDIVNVPGIGQLAFEDIKDLITVESD